jgi:hypothetical protein
MKELDNIPPINQRLCYRIAHIRAVEKSVRQRVISLHEVLAKCDDLDRMASLLDETYRYWLECTYSKSMLDRSRENFISINLYFVQLKILQAKAEEHKHGYMFHYDVDQMKTVIADLLELLK